MALQDALQIVCLSDTGQVREHNEDSVDAAAQWGLVVLADGMGGYNAGEVASEMTTSAIVAGVAQYWLPDCAPDHAGALALLEEQIRLANHAVYDRAQTEEGCEGMGTTVVACLFHDNTVSVGHLGDSRLYRLRNGELTQVTTDHSVLQEQIEAGILTRAEARLSLHKNLVTRALGIEPQETGEMHQYAVEVDDVYLLCSDGLNDMLEDDEIQSTLSLLQVDLDLCARELVKAANEAGGADNVSVILVRVLQDFSSSETLEI